MFIHISQTKSPERVGAVNGSIKNWHFAIHKEVTEYLFETPRLLWIIDTNLTRDKEQGLRAAIETMAEPDCEKLETLLNGNFFAAVLDKEQQRLTLLRDPSGVKTGYFSVDGTELFVGSIMHEVANARSSVDFHPEAVHQLLYSGYLLDGYTLYADVQELTMGTTLVLDGQFRPLHREKVSIRLAERDNELSPEQNFRMLREESRKAHEGYVGPANRVLLSGGLDSIAMLICLDDLQLGDRLDSLSFKVKGTTQDETVYAQSIAQHLGIENQVLEINPDDVANFEGFEETLLRMNNPYFGVWIFGNFRGTPHQMFYAGQDTRLHTPALNEVDKWAFALLPYQNRFWMRFVAQPLARLAGNFMKLLGWPNSKNRILKNLYKATHIFDLKRYLRKFYLKLDPEKIAAAGLPTTFYSDFEKHFEFDLDSIPTERALYNKLVELKWKEQYVYDMRYLQDVARINQTYIAMPFYNRRLAEFSSSIPFRLATKPMVGQDRFGEKKWIVYKYALRHAFRDKLNDLTFYRAKAVSNTLHQLFNGVMGQKVRSLLIQDLANPRSLIQRFQLQAFVQRFLHTDFWEMEDSSYLMTIYYIGALTVYNRHIVCRQSGLKKGVFPLTAYWAA